MRNLVDLAWIRSRDTAEKLADASDETINEAIGSVSAVIIQKVGHDFGQVEDSEQEFDGQESSRLDLTGRTQYPLSRLTSVYIDNVRIHQTSIIARTNRRIGVTTSLILKSGLWTGYTVKLVGDFGWTDTPEDVKEAAFRLVCIKINGLDEEKNTVRSVKHPDGVAIEYAVQDIISNSQRGTGDEYADNVIRNYWWKESGGMV